MQPLCLMLADVSDFAQWIGFIIIGAIALLIELIKRNFSNKQRGADEETSSLPERTLEDILREIRQEPNPIEVPAKLPASPPPHPKHLARGHTPSSDEPYHNTVECDAQQSLTASQEGMQQMGNVQEKALRTFQEQPAVPPPLTPLAPMKGKIRPLSPIQARLRDKRSLREIIVCREILSKPLSLR